MPLAVCDTEALQPLHRLISGPFENLNDLPEIERLVRAVVLHDEMIWETVPIPCEAEYADKVIVTAEPAFAELGFLNRRPTPTSGSLLAYSRRVEELGDYPTSDEPLSERPVLDIAHYLKPYGCGMFALLVSRRGPDFGGSHAACEQWIGGNKMIVHLSDMHILEMLDLRAKGGEAQEVIRQQIADFRMSL